MNKLYIVTLDDVAQRRATVTAVKETTVEAYGRMQIHAQNYAVVSDENLVPTVGERVTSGTAHASVAAKRDIDVSRRSRRQLRRALINRIQLST